MNDPVIDFTKQRRAVQFERVSEVPRLQAMPNFPFLLRHHPKQVGFHTITLEDGRKQGYWLPEITPLGLLAGTNKIKLGKRNSKRPDYKMAKLELEEAGWVFLAPTEAWNGEPVLCEYDCEHPKSKDAGIFYATIFDLPGGNDETAEGDVILEYDFEQHSRWVHSLVVAGKLPVPSKRAWGQKLKQAETRLRRLGKGAHGNNEVENEYTEWKKFVTAMRAALLPGDPNDPLAPTTPLQHEPEGGVVRRPVDPAELQSGQGDAPASSGRRRATG